MSTASPYAIRERRVNVMLSGAQASPAESAPHPIAQRSLLFRLAPAITVVCGLTMFLVLFGRERVLPHAAIRNFVEAPARAAALAPAVPQAPIEKVAMRLRQSRRFTEMNGLSARLVLTNVKRQFCDLDVRGGRRGYRRIRIHAGQSIQLPATEGKLTLIVDAISSGRVAGSLERGG